MIFNIWTLAFDKKKAIMLICCFSSSLIILLTKCFLIHILQIVFLNMLITFCTVSHFCRDPVLNLCKITSIIKWIFIIKWDDVFFHAENLLETIFGKDKRCVEMIRWNFYKFDFQLWQQFWSFEMPQSLFKICKTGKLDL